MSQYDLVESEYYGSQIRYASFHLMQMTPLTSTLLIPVFLRFGILKDDTFDY